MEFTRWRIVKKARVNEWCLNIILNETGRKVIFLDKYWSFQLYVFYITFWKFCYFMLMMMVVYFVSFGFLTVIYQLSQ